MTKNNKKISSSDFKLWSQILDKVEPIKKSGRSIIQNQSKSIIDEDDRDSGDVTEQNTKIKKVRQSHVIDEKSLVKFTIITTIKKQNLLGSIGG